MNSTFSYLRLKSIITLLLICSMQGMWAQVTIGDQTPPLSVSVLEIISSANNRGGLRLPQLTSSEVEELRTKIEAMTDQALAQRAIGLLIYNTDINCAMYWNGTAFASLCGTAPSSISVDCSSITVPPIEAGIALNPSINSISVTVTSTSPGPFSISLNGNGISFSGEGTFYTGSAANPTVQVVTLVGTGTATKIGAIDLSLTNRLNGQQLCTKNVVFAYPRMVLLGLGDGIYQPGSASSTSGTSNTFLNGAPNSFGTLATSKVPTSGLTLIDGATPSNATALQTLITNNKPDIIYMGYPYHPTTDAIAVLKTFVTNGGVLIQASQNATLYQIANSVFGTTVFMASATAGSSYLHQIADPTPGATDKDPIIHGPFSDAAGIAGKRWADDVNDGWAFSSYPSTDPNLIIYSWHPNNTARPSCIRHKTLGYIGIGDGGFVAGDFTNTSTVSYPFKLDSTTRLPIGKNYAGGASANNSEFFGNIMAWAINYVYNKKYGSN